MQLKGHLLLPGCVCLCYVCAQELRTLQEMFEQSEKSREASEIHVWATYVLQCMCILLLCVTVGFNVLCVLYVYACGLAVKQEMVRLHSEVALMQRDREEINKLQQTMAQKAAALVGFAHMGARIITAHGHTAHRGGG